MTEAIMAAEGADIRMGMGMGREQKGLCQQEGTNTGVCSKSRIGKIWVGEGAVPVDL